MICSVFYLTVHRICGLVLEGLFYRPVRPSGSIFFWPKPHKTYITSAQYHNLSAQFIVCLVCPRFRYLDHRPGHHHRSLCNMLHNHQFHNKESLSQPQHLTSKFDVFINIHRLLAPDAQENNNGHWPHLTVPGWKPLPMLDSSLGTKNTRDSHRLETTPHASMICNRRTPNFPNDGRNWKLLWCLFSTFCALSIEPFPLACRVILKLPLLYG